MITDKEIEQLASTNLPDNNFNPYAAAPDIFGENLQQYQIDIKVALFYPVCMWALAATIIALVLAL